MKALIGMAVLSASVLALGACATTAEEDDTMGYSPSNVYDSDEAYMARVEAAARRRGIDVQWVHPPRTADTGEAVATADE